MFSLGMRGVCWKSCQFFEEATIKTRWFSYTHPNTWGTAAVQRLRQHSRHLLQVLYWKPEAFPDHHLSPSSVSWAVHWPFSWWDVPGTPSEGAVHVASGTEAQAISADVEEQRLCSELLRIG
ncbi:hypothetical protein ILYODFUR_023732 [Ilyodon furcidens]|uniref:Uncharacterized protein n=1 Tax=Ilyodon furcidens TaxID=33524 RepID=A0ABV0U883_9TELE